MTAVLLMFPCAQANAAWSFPHPRLSPTPNPNHVLSVDLNDDGHVDLVASAVDWGRIDVALGRGDGTFEPPIVHTVDGSPAFMVLADLDGDGRDDLAATNKYSAPVSVLMGNGDGTFGAETQYGQAADRGGIAIGDFNEDGEIDLLSMGQTNAFLLFGSGDGSFGGEVSLPGHWFSVAVDDFDGDGFDDYAYTLPDDGLVAIQLGNGDGTFSSGGTHAVGNGPTWVASADVSGDANTDLVVVNNDSTTGDISVLIGNGDGTFAPEQRHALDDAGSYPVFVLVTDVDDDGFEDIAVSHWWSLPSVSLLFGSGGGQFGAAVGTNPTTGFAQTLAIADLDEDDVKDLVQGDGSRGGLAVILGQGEREFTNVIHQGVGEAPSSLAVVDLDGDGRLDLITTNLDTSDVSVLLAEGAGTFEPEKRFCVADSPPPIPPCTGGAQLPLDLGLGEFTGDDHVDLAVRLPHEVSILEGDGAGNFNVLSHFGVGFTFAGGSIVVGDLDGDANDDLVVSSLYDGEIRVFLGNGDGTFVGQPLVPVGDEPLSMKLGDLDGDPHRDLVVTNRGSNTVTVLLGNGDGTFANSATLGTGPQPADTVIGDLDGDLLADLFVLKTPQTGGALVFRGEGDGTFSPFPLLVETVGSASALIGDVDHDGLFDVAMAGNGAGSVNLLPGHGDGTFGPLQSYRTRFDDETVLAAGDLNLDFRLDLVHAAAGSDSVSVLLNQSGPRSLSFLSDRITLVWPAATGALSYDVYRGQLSDLVDTEADGLPDNGYGTCLTDLDDDPRDTRFVDPELPLAGSGFTYLKSVLSIGGDGGIGRTSSGLPRSPTVPCP